MRLLDRGVNGLTEPEIVRIYDQVIQCASSNPTGNSPTPKKLLAGLAL
jgi:hypothetical protein